MKSVLKFKNLFFVMLFVGCVYAEPAVSDVIVQSTLAEVSKEVVAQVVIQPKKELTLYQKIKAKLLQHKKKVIAGTIATTVFAVWLWKHLHKTSSLPEPEDQTNVQNNTSTKNSGELQAPPGGVAFAPIKKKTKLFYDEKQRIERGTLLTKSSMVLTPELEKYKFTTCKVLPQLDCTSCGQRSMVNAAYICKALQEGKTIGHELFTTQEEKDEYNALLQEVDVIKPLKNCTTIIGRFEILNTKNKASKLYRFMEQLKARSINPKIHNEQMVVDFTCMSYSSNGIEILEDFLNDSECPYKNHLVQRFQAGVPQLISIGVTYKHCITLLFELKKDEKTGLLKPHVTCFDGKEFDYSNDPQINALLYLFTRGMPYQVGKLEQGKEVEDVFITQWAEGQIGKLLDSYGIENPVLPEQLQKEQKHYQSAKFIFDEKQARASVELDELYNDADLRRLEEKERKVLLVKS